MYKFLILVFMLSLSNTHTYSNRTKIDSYLKYARIFSRATLTGFAQGTVNATFREEPCWKKYKKEIRSGTWAAAIASETVLHWNNKKGTKIDQIAVGFLGLGVGQVVGELSASIRQPDYPLHKKCIDTLNLHLACAVLAAAYSFFIEHNNNKHHNQKVQ